MGCMTQRVLEAIKFAGREDYDTLEPQGGRERLNATAHDSPPPLMPTLSELTSPLSITAEYIKRIGKSCRPTPPATGVEPAKGKAIGRSERPNRPQSARLGRTLEQNIRVIEDFAPHEFCVETGVERDAHGIRGRLRLKLAHHVAAMDFHRPRADIQFHRDGLVGAALDQQSEHVGLARGQALDLLP